jgi:hemolysin activation/secretion protein
MLSGVWRVLAALAMVCVSCAAGAQVIPSSEQPGRERERFTQPAAPRAQPGGSAISLPSTVAPPGAEKISLLIRGVRVSGATVYRVEDLAPLYADVVGRTVSLQAVYEVARRITARYGGDGYMLSRAIVPPQTLDPHGAVIRIEVIEGYVDRIEWPAKLARYRDFFSAYAARITADRPANIRTIERYLLLAGDLPGLKISTSLRPSKTNVGASTLVVEVNEKPIDASARADNRGTAARGPNQFQTSATVNNLLAAHEAFTVTYAGVSPVKELQYVQGIYRQVLTSEGLTAFIDASDSWGRPGTPSLEMLQYATRSIVMESGLSYPVIRARERNLTLTGLVFLSDNFANVFDLPATRDLLRGARFKADGDAADRLNGINQFNVTFSKGVQGLGSTLNDNPIPSRANGRVDFAKVEAYVARTQPLIGSFSALLQAYGQYALTPLLAPEQCGYGGRVFGRAYDPSDLLGDSCWEVSGELRYDLPTTVPFALAQFYGFIDYGRLHNINAAGTPTNLLGASTGGGVRVGRLDGVTADFSVAKAIDGPRNDNRFFVILTARN